MHGKLFYEGISIYFQLHNLGWDVLPKVLDIIQFYSFYEKVHKKQKTRLGYFINVDKYFDKLFEPQIYWVNSSSFPI